MDLRPILRWLTSLDTVYFFAATLLFFLAAGYYWKRFGFGQPVKIFAGAGMLLLTIVIHSGTIFYWHSVLGSSQTGMDQVYPLLGLSDLTGLGAAIYLIRVLAFPLMGWPACVTIWSVCAIIGTVMHSWS